jgi:hypothetical protein
LVKVSEQIDKIALVGTDPEAAIKEARKQLADAIGLVNLIVDTARTVVNAIDGEYVMN